MQNQPTTQSGSGNAPLTGARGYALAAACVGAAFGTRAALDPVWGNRFPYVIFFAAVFVVIQLTEFGPFLVALVSGFLLGDWFFVIPRHSLFVSRASDQITTVIYFLLGFMMLYFSQRARRALLREQAAKRELRQQAEALAESEARFSTIFRASPISIGFSRVADGRFVDVNETFLRLFGFAREEVIGRTSLELGMWPVTDERTKLIQLLEEKGRVQQFEAKFRRQTGEIGDLLISAELLELHGERYLLGMLQDITERKLIEERMRHSHKMEAIGHLAGGVAHEFNNVLAAMMLNLDLLRIDPHLPSNAAASLSDLQQGASRAATLTRRLLQFGRRQVLQPRILDLASLLHDLYRDLQGVFGEQIQVQNGSPAVPRWVNADRSLMEQVITTLAVNARDAMPEGGRLRFDIQRATIEAAHAQQNGEARPGTFVCLSVSDTGRGMAAAERARVFEPFFTTKDIGQGTGLGLASVYGIVKQHQGWIEVESAPGKGTTFRVYLPEAAAPEPAAGTERTQLKSTGVPLPSGTETILLVEDEDSVRKIFATSLRRLGYRVLDAENGEKALALWEREGKAASLLFTDMMMPDGLSGLDLAQQLRQQKPDLKVLIASGYSMDLFDPARPNSAPVGFLKKPFSLDELASAVRAALAGI